MSECGRLFCAGSTIFRLRLTDGSLRQGIRGGNRATSTIPGSGFRRWPSLAPLKVEDAALLGHYEHLVEIEIEPPVIDLARYVETARKLPERRGDEQPNAIDVRAIGCN